MKFTIQRNEILKAINIIKEALPAKTVIDSLKGIKIDVNENKIIFTASRQDLAITYTSTENFQVYETGLTILPGSYLITIINKTDEEEFEFTQVDGSTLVKTTKSKINLVGYDSNSYPIIDFDLNNGVKINLDVDTLIKSYNQTKNSVAPTNLKPILTGLNFKFGPEGLQVGSTDARRLSISNFDIKTNEVLDFTIFKPLLGSIIKILDVVELVNIEIIYNQNQLILIAGNILLKARLLEGKFPDINRLIPAKPNYSYEVDSRMLLSVLEKIQLLSDRDNGNVTTKIVDGQLLLEAFFKELGGMEELCLIDNLVGNPFSISFDPKFLIDAVHSINSEKLRIEFVDEISVFSISSTESRDNLQIIAPIRLT